MWVASRRAMQGGFQNERENIQSQLRGRGVLFVERPCRVEQPTLPGSSRSNSADAQPACMMSAGPIFHHRMMPRGFSNTFLSRCSNFALSGIKSTNDRGSHSA